MCVLKLRFIAKVIVISFLQVVFHELVRLLGCIEGVYINMCACTSGRVCVCDGGGGGVEGVICVHLWQHMLVVCYIVLSLLCSCSTGHDKVSLLSPTS